MEPYFFVGAMHVTYVLGALFTILIIGISKFALAVSNVATLWITLSGLLILFPVIARLSRNIWINLFLNYDKSKTKTLKND
jgi:hypothetical protein